MKVAFLSGVNSGLDNTRGIGVHTNTLILELKKLKNKDFEIVENADNANITHITKFNPFFLSVPFSKPSKKVVLTIHDLIPLIYPEHYPPGIKGWINFLINKYLIWKNVDSVITISETSKKDICRFLKVDPKIVHVIYLAPRRIFKKITSTSILYSIEVKYKLPKKFALYVGDVNYNKNIPVLIKACKMGGIPLVIAGKQAKEVENMDLDHAELRHLKDTNWTKIVKLGFVPDDDLVKIYNLATVYVQPSLYEGFGLPIIEAFAAGCPVVASKTQALVEIGEGACLFADPNDPLDMAQKILQIINDKSFRNQLIETGKVLVKNFTWEKTAIETLEIYENV